MTAGFRDRRESFFGRSGSAGGGRIAPALFKAKVERGDKGGRLRMSGTFRLKQTNYGIKPYSAAGGLAKVADELEISGDLELKPKSDK